MVEPSETSDLDRAHEPDETAENADERALIARAQAGQRDALATIYATHAPAIQRFLRDLLSDATLAADATQETFVRAFRRFDTLRDSTRVAPWLFGIARNISLELRKTRARHGRVMIQEEDAGIDSPSYDVSPEAALIGREAVQLVGRALEKLSEDRRAVLLLRLDHGLPYDAIAETMGWSLAKTKVEIFRAREVLREVMRKYEEGHR